MYKVGMYGGSFNPIHNGHVKCIRKAKALCQELHVTIGILPNRDIIPGEEKLKLFQAIFKDDPGIIFHYFVDEIANKNDYTFDTWWENSLKAKNMIHKPIDVVFCGSDYQREDNPYCICYPESDIIYFDRTDSISSTKIRGNPLEHLEEMPKEVGDYFKRYYLKK